MSSSSPNRSQPWTLPTALVVISLLIVVSIGAWLYFQRQPQPDQPDSVKPDVLGAAHANTRGVGLMEQFRYIEAISEFEKAVELAPDWTPAKINLGIALLNTQRPENLDRAIDIFKRVLDQDPNNPYAHYCTGIIHQYRGNLAAAGPHFAAVTRIDPNDAHAWYFLGSSRSDSSDSEDSFRNFETALKLNPYLNSARYALAQHRITADNPARKQQLLEEFQAISRANATDLLDIKYTEMGRHAEVIGKSPVSMAETGVMPLFDPVKSLSVKLAPNTEWANNDKAGDVLRQVRSRFGGGMVVLDFNRDGKLDLFLPAAILQAGRSADLLLRNDGNNVYTDVTAEVGLLKAESNFGAAVGDFDNDGFPDLALAGPFGLKLFRNADGKKFEDVTATAGFDKHPGVFLTASWIDLDQDGDLDLVAAKYAETLDATARQLRGEKLVGGRLVVFANAGVAPPAPKPGDPLPPLSVAFKPVTEPEALVVRGPVTGVITTDVDGDLDIDLIVLVDGLPPVTVLNDRMLRFRRGDSVCPNAGLWNGGFVLEANGDDQPDLVLIEAGAPPRVLISKTDHPGGSIDQRFAQGSTDSPSLRTAAWVDLDLDGRTDLVGLSNDGQPTFLRGDSNGKFTRKEAPFGPDADSISELVGVLPVDLDADSNVDLLAWSATGGPRAFRSLGNGNNGLRVSLTGKRKPLTAGEEGKPLRTNADGVGAWVRVHAGPLRTAAENTTLFAGLGQSRLPIHFGLGKADVAEALRVRWPDAVIQAELNQSGYLVSIVEFDRKPSSCPILFTWDGERFVYITDFLGAGSMGESGPDGSTRPPRPEESVKIEPGRLVPRNGKYILKLTEPMDEIMYLDRIRLDVIDHPSDVFVFPDERFATTDPQPSQERLFFRDSERLFATKATDHRGKDVTATLRERDNKHVEGFALRSWLGFAEDHHIELDFAGLLKSLPSERRLLLVLAGWTDYAFPESIYAATQAGVPPIWPVLEQKQADGSWKRLGEIGLPAGLTRVMTTDVTGWIDPAGGPIRIRTNLRIYWDQVFLAPLAQESGHTVRELGVSRAAMEHRGFTQEYSPGGKLPIAYDYDRLEPVAVTRWRGKVTRTGDVTELLNDVDDRFVVCGPGDEITAEFDATQLPELPAGWKRSFVLRTWGYVKDSAPTTLTAGQVGPLPFRQMPAYPYDPAKFPPPAHVSEYDRFWNTRSTGGR